MSTTDPPVWRRDFPYTSAGEDEVTRREFVRYLALASGAFAAGSVGVAAWTSLRTVNTGAPRAIVALDQLPVGGAHLFRYPTKHDPAILVRPAEDEIRGYSQKCTHLGCVVYWSPGRDGGADELVCPCHEGVFDGHSGAVVSGPPQRPLGRIDVEVRDDGMVWALRGEGA